VPGDRPAANPPCWKRAAPCAARCKKASTKPPQNYTRSARQEIHAQFVRLPNPDLVMYIYPHLAGHEGAPIPGYSTVFPLHQKIHYALPGEHVAEDR